MPKKLSPRYKHGAIKAVAEECGTTTSYVSQIKNNRQDPATDKAQAVKAALKKYEF